MPQKSLRVLVTGANGFIGKNLVVRLDEIDGVTIQKLVRSDDIAVLPKVIANTDVIIHLAGLNRHQDPRAFEIINTGLTESICEAVRAEYTRSRRKISFFLVSSIQATQNNPYGQSKLSAEKAVQSLASEIDVSVIIYRLPGVFGKWCKPNYNSVVATFCHNLARGEPIEIHNGELVIPLVYIDDVVDDFINSLRLETNGAVFKKIHPQYEISLSDLARQIRAFANCRSNLSIEPTGVGFIRALYATYTSYLPKNCFCYEIPEHLDGRGKFVEVLKTVDSGQFSYFTLNAGMTRGRHYHHTKTEKFLVLKGEALFRFRHILSGEMFSLKADGERAQVVDTIPGWAHEITNIGQDELIAMLWSNENFDPKYPDTYESKL